MNTLPFHTLAQFSQVRQAQGSRRARARLLAAMCRVNALSAIMAAGSGHPGSSLSAMDLMCWLFFERMHRPGRDPQKPERDVFLSSKGHDAPALYAVLCGLGLMDVASLARLRRLGGPEGHPDLAVPGVEAVSGSLGMGLSKARGMALAKQMRGQGGNVYVLLGDGELQEGQNAEAMRAAVVDGLENLYAVVDHNAVQSDRLVRDTMDLGDVERLFAGHGWTTARCDGHDFTAIQAALDFLDRQPGPRVLVADTIKGKGVSFMEHPAALESAGGWYNWHAGAPGQDDFARANEELAAQVASMAQALGLEPPQAEELPVEPRPAPGPSTDNIAQAYGQALLELGERIPELVVLDADLIRDCRLSAFAERFPERFLECGIAEQDMVSCAGGLALAGMLPVVNSFAAFLTGRAGEQITVNAMENTRVIHACHYAGLLPAGAGKTHQSVRDAAVLTSIPGMTVVEPVNGWETARLLALLAGHIAGPSALRLHLGPSPADIALPLGYEPFPGRGVLLAPGAKALIVTCGPVLAHQALLARELLAARGIDAGVMHMPWLNRIDPDWLRQTLASAPMVLVAHAHGAVGSLGAAMLAQANAAGLLGSTRLELACVEGQPRCGLPGEVLAAHGLDAASLAGRIAGALAKAGA